VVVAKLFSIISCKLSLNQTRRVTVFLGHAVGGLFSRSATKL